MAIAHVTALRNILADAVDTAINGSAGDTGGDLEILDATVTLVEIEFEATAFGAASSGVITLNGVPLSENATAAGTADNFVMRDKGDNDQITGSVTATSGGGDIELDNTNIASGQSVAITALTYTAPV